MSKQSTHCNTIANTPEEGPSNKTQLEFGCEKSKADFRLEYMPYDSTPSIRSNREIFNSLLRDLNRTERGTGINISTSSHNGSNGAMETRS